MLSLTGGGRHTSAPGVPYPGGVHRHSFKLFPALQVNMADVERNGYCFSDGVGCISPGEHSSLYSTQYTAPLTLPSYTLYIAGSSPATEGPQTGFMTTEQCKPVPYNASGPPAPKPAGQWPARCTPRLVAPPGYLRCSGLPSSSGLPEVWNLLREDDSLSDSLCHNYGSSATCFFSLSAADASMDVAWCCSMLAAELLEEVLDVVRPLRTEEDPTITAMQVGLAQ